MAVKATLEFFEVARSSLGTLITSNAIIYADALSGMVNLSSGA